MKIASAVEKPEEKTVNEIKNKLDAKIPREVIAEREGGGKRKLSYLEGWYVISRLNEVLGQGNWAYQTEQMNLVFAGEVGDKQTVHYIAKVVLEVRGLGEMPVYFSDYGYGDGSDKYNIGKAHELAVKEAVTDGIKRCAKNLGMSMGLALYDKTQENVEDAEEPAKPRAVAQGPKPAAKATVAPVPAEISPSVITEAPADRKKLNELITELSMVAIKQKKTDVPKLKEEMKTRYGATDKEKLADVQALDLFNYLKEMVNGKTE